MRIFSCLVAGVLALVLVVAVGCPKTGRQNTVAGRVIEHDPLDNMPIVGGYGPDIVASYPPPIEQRGQEYRKWLAPVVKIDVGNGSGSGTIVYHDTKMNVAYIATCGHLWTRGVTTVEEALRKNIRCRVITWYHNGKKLDRPQTYEARVIFSSWRSGCDTALVTFQPDWVPQYLPIAPRNHPVPPGIHLHSVGCDGGREVAHYDVEVMGMERAWPGPGYDLVTRYNSPRPGRSGGGLMDDMFYVGTCWGTEYKDGTGRGFFTPLSVIHDFWSKQPGYAWLLNVTHTGGHNARQLPVVDRNTPQRKYTEEYIPLPLLR